MAWGLIKEAIKRLIRFGLVVTILRSYPLWWLASSVDLQRCSVPLSVVEVLCLTTCTVEHDYLFLWLYSFQSLGLGRKGVEEVTSFILSFYGKIGLCLFKGCNFHCYIFLYFCQYVDNFIFIKTSQSLGDVFKLLVLPEQQSKPQRYSICTTI